MRKTLKSRLEEKFIRLSDDVCWPWVANKNNHGYGMIREGGKAPKILAHRAMYEITYGPIDENLVVRHKCDNPGCVNPKHLETGTQSDNLIDRTKRGRLVSVAMTEEQALSIAAWFFLGYGPAEVSRKTGVSIHAVKGTHRRKTRTYLNW